MRNILCLLMLLISSAALAQALSSEEIAEAQRMAREYQNDPKFKAQMKQVQQRMQREGMSVEPAQGMKTMPDMSAENMDAMMRMSQCMMDGIGEKEMEAMSKRGEALSRKIKTLCDAGKKDEAEKAARDYAKEMMASREYKAMKGCMDAHKELINDPAMKQMRDQMSRMEGKKDGICEQNQSPETK